MAQSVAVYCGSRLGDSPAFVAAARALGRLIAEGGSTLVYGGGRVGLMGAVADAAIAASGRVIGVIPQALMDREVGHTGLAEQHVVQTMHERKMLMAERADAFIALARRHWHAGGVVRGLDLAPAGLSRPAHRRCSTSAATTTTCSEFMRVSQREPAASCRDAAVHDVLQVGEEPEGLLLRLADLCSQGQPKRRLLQDLRVSSTWQVAQARVGARSDGRFVGFTGANAHHLFHRR